VRGRAWGLSELWIRRTDKRWARRLLDIDATRCQQVRRRFPAMTALMAGLLSSVFLWNSAQTLPASMTRASTRGAKGADALALDNPSGPSADIQHG
jgi:hypothetical protein